MSIRHLQKARKNLNSIRSASTWPLSPSSSDLVVFEDSNRTGIIILNRPKALNTFALTIPKDINHQLKVWQETKELVLIAGAGGKAFCAGGDVQSLLKDSRVAGIGKKTFGVVYQNISLIAQYKKPFVSIIDGITMGGGVGIAGLGVTPGKYQIATENTLLAMPENAIGLLPDAGAGYFFPRLKGKLGYFLGLTGFRLKGSDVVKAGMATHFVERSRISDLFDELTKVQRSEEVEGILQKYNKVDCAPFSLEKHLGQIEECFSADSVEEIFERLQKDGSKWALETLNALRKQSPTSLKVTKKHFDLGTNVSLEDTLNREFGIMARLMKANKDFKEGVRALLIDKDQSPKWDPDSLEKVSQEYVDSFFLPLADEEELKLKLKL